MDQPKLFMLLLGCKPKGRNTEQHDIFFSVGHTIKDLIPEMMHFWPEAGTKIHVDAWREVTSVSGYSIHIESREKAVTSQAQSNKLFFINLGGYKPNEFEEYHYKTLAVAQEKGAAIKAAMQTAFYKHTSFEGAPSHIDDKYGIDVDDTYEITDLLPFAIKEKYQVIISQNSNTVKEDSIHLGYFNLNRIREMY